MRRTIVLLALVGLASGCAEPESGDNLTAQNEAASGAGDNDSASVKNRDEASNSDSERDTVVTGKYNELNDWESKVILQKYTERAFTGEYDTKMDPGTYICRQCNAKLYRSEDKFDAHCGWPAFDDEIDGAVKQVPDADGMRVEIVCANCDGHLGHVFTGERKTKKNVRHCVNSVSMLFVPQGDDLPALIKLNGKGE